MLSLLVRIEGQAFPHEAMEDMESDTSRVSGDARQPILACPFDLDVTPY